ncbi:hypothetical protein CRYUN_Cryun02cG0102300 [Craigia yunnanensis]
MGLRSFSLIFLASLIGVTINQNIYYEGLYLATSSMASAMGNLVPAITFVMASIVGLEKVNVRSLRSTAKIAGTVICVTGSIFMALLRGPKLLNAQILPAKSFFGSEVIVTILAALLLHEEIYTGSLIGVVGVIGGLYVVLWGKAKDFQVINKETADPESQNDQKSTMKTSLTDESLQTSYKLDLEEPLLSYKSTDTNEYKP